MTVRRAFLEWPERDFFVRTVDRLPIDTARDGAGMAVFCRCEHDRSAEWLLSFRWQRENAGRDCQAALRE